MDHGFILLAIAVVAGVVLLLALRQGEWKVLVEKVMGLQTQMRGLDAKIESVKTNDIAHVQADTRDIRYRVEQLQNALYSRTQELVLEVVSRLQAAGCTAAACPYLAAQKTKEIARLAGEPTVGIKR